MTFYKKVFDAIDEDQKLELIMELAEKRVELESTADEDERLEIIMRVIEIRQILTDETVEPTPAPTVEPAEAEGDPQRTKDLAVVKQVQDKTHSLMDSPDLKDVLSEILNRYRGKDQAMMDEINGAIDAWRDYIYAAVAPLIEKLRAVEAL